MKQFYLLLIFMVTLIPGVSAQTECTVKIGYVMNKSLPPSYTFTTDYEGEESKYYWYFSDKATYEEPTPVHTFSYTDYYTIAVKIVSKSGSVCYGRIYEKFEGKTETRPGETIHQATGMVKDLSNLGGCRLGIQTAEGKMLLPVKIIPEFILKPGQHVKISYELMQNAPSICMAGAPVTIHRIEEIPVTTPGILYGRGRVTDASQIAGCSMVIKLDNGRTIIPAEVVPDFSFKDGQMVEVAFEVLEGYASACNMGPLVKIHKIAEIAPPQPSCKVEPSYVVLNAKELKYRFFAKTSGPVDYWEWDFGDGNQSSEPEPEHQFKAPGAYGISCTIVLKDGCKVSRKISLLVNAPGLPVCLGATNLMLFDPTENGCDGKAIAAILDKEGNEYKGVVYRWSNGATGNIAEALCSDKVYYMHAVIDGVCQKNTSFSFLSRPQWRVTNSKGIYTFEVISPVDGVTYLWEFGDGSKAYGVLVNYEFEEEGTYYVRLTAMSGSDQAESEQAVVFDKSGLTGINEHSFANLQIYPNPAYHMVRLEPWSPLSGETRIEIYDIRGQKRMEQMVKEYGIQSVEINMSELPAGIYMVRITPEKQAAFTKKLVVSRP